MDDRRVGLVGLGRMGAAIGGCLLRRGYALGVVGHVSRGPVDELVRAGAREFADPSALAGWALGAAAQVAGPAATLPALLSYFAPRSPGSDS